MYTIIGGDGKEYGPVTAEQVRSWIAGGRANLDTKIKEVGADTWKTVGEYPEIVGPASAPGGAVAAAATTARTPEKLDILSCYERSWTLLKANFWPLVGVCFLMSMLGGALEYSQYKGLYFATPLLGGVLSAGLYFYFLKKIRGLPVTFGDLFAGFTKAFVALVVASLLIAIFSTVGLLLLVLPGIYLIVSYSFTYINVVDKGLGFWEAMERSRKVVTAQWWRVLGLLLLSIPFILLGLAALIFGIFVAIPLITGAFVYAYEDLFNPAK
jgi:uncharacterized membrane protein